MKTCFTCRLTKPLSDFNNDKMKSDGKRYQCILCTRQYLAEHRKKRAREGNPLKTKKSANFINNKKLVYKIKQENGCSCCAETFADCLEFHHVDRSQKEFSISQALGKTIDEILDEISKCALVCSNCHKKIHADVIECPTPFNSTPYRNLVFEIVGKRGRKRLPYSARRDYNTKYRNKMLGANT